VPVPKHKEIKRRVIDGDHVRGRLNKSGVLEADKGKIPFKPALGLF
jgi:hypothetical protein